MITVILLLSAECFILFSLSSILMLEQILQVI